MQEAATIPTLVWLERGQESLVAAIAGVSGLRMIAAGYAGDPRPPDAPAFPGAEPVSDLRAALASTPAHAVFLACPVRIDDTELLRIARARSLRLLSLEPVPASIAESRAAEPSGWMEHCRFVGLFRAAAALATADELFASLGPIRMLSVSFRGGTGQGSLGARLFDAMHTAHSILGVPESIDASVVTRVAASGVRLEPGESLRTLRGDLTANMRFAGARAAALALSDRAGRWFRGVTIVADTGCVRIDESGVERVDPEGHLIESPAKPKRRGKAPAQTTFEDIVDKSALAALGEAARRAVDPRAPKPDPFDLAEVLAMCEAAILSARTGQPESPATVLRMAT